MVEVGLRNDAGGFKHEAVIVAGGWINNGCVVPIDVVSRFEGVSEHCIIPVASSYCKLVFADSGV